MLTSRFPRLCRVLVVVVGRNINQGWEKGGAPRVGYFYHQAKVSESCEISGESLDMK